MLSLYDYWFSNKNVWFNPTQIQDEYITNTFFKDEYFSLYTPKTEYSYLDNFKKGFEMILLFDQVPRHANRVLGNIDCNTYTSRIIRFAEKFYAKYLYAVNPEEYAFILLPLRHSKDYEKILFVIKETIIKIKTKPEKLEFKRFLKATLERYISQCDDTQNIEVIVPRENIQEIYDSTNICELGLELYRPRLIEKDVPKNFMNTFKFIEDKEINKNIKIISLSGGVDSMVMSYILTKKYGSDNVVAVHINYNNRKECQDEVEIIKLWCSFLKIKLYIRKIIELNRPECMELELRDLYESFTRDIRYSTYLNVSRLVKSENCIVYLGHNKDDRFENILTNITSESHYHNLNGMELKTIQLFQDDSITFIRPMLNIVKSDIFSFANYCQIPHFVDSTPKWSQRGKIRDLVRPAIESWNPKTIDSFFELSNVLSDLISIAESTADFYVKKINEERTFKIKISDIPQKILFKTIFVKLGLNITQKGLDAFYEKIEFIKNNFDKYKINSKNFYQLNKTTKLEWKKINIEEFIIIF
jgi:tRNA(Ile)-lysidine synthetase-like protein